MKNRASSIAGSDANQVSRGCFYAAPIATRRAATGVDDRINTHVRRSRREPRRPTIGWRSLVLWIAHERVPGDLSGPFHGRLDRKRASVCQRRLMPKRSAAAEGVGDARRPAPVQIDHSGRRGPFPGLESFQRFAAAPACVGARPVIGRRRRAVAGSPGAHGFAHPFARPLPRDRPGTAALAMSVGIALAVARAGRRAAAPADAPVARSRALSPSGS